MAKKEFKEVMNGLFNEQEEKETTVDVKPTVRGKGRPSMTKEDKLFQKISLNIDAEIKAYLEWVMREYKITQAQYIRSLVTSDMRHNEEYKKER